MIYMNTAAATAATMTVADARQWVDAFTTCCAKVVAGRGCTVAEAVALVVAEMDDRRRANVQTAMRTLNG